jgi:hypothetical protein
MYYKFKENKFIDSIIIVIATVIAVLFISNVIIDSIGSWQDIVAIASALGTVWAAVATWLAARKASESAQIARQSMEYSVDLGKKTLEETQTSNRHTAFENRYAMLLAQHDNYHNQLCSYLDKGKMSKPVYEEIKKLTCSKRTDRQQNQIDIYEFFHASINEPGIKNCMAFLTGHEIISRYMRTLYHLLKFVHTEDVSKGTIKTEFQKNYTSSVRSTIRNDVLLLIAVNALNVRSQRAKNASYPYYQEMLHDFSFFEHAIFMFPSNPNSLFSQDNWTKEVQDQIINTQSAFSTKLRSQMDDTNSNFRVPEVRLISPLIMVLYIFDNPMRKAVLKALESLGLRWEVNGHVIEIIEKAKERVQHSVQFVEQIPSCRYQSSSCSGWNKITEEILSDIDVNTFKAACKSDACKFEMVNNGQIMPLDGKLVRDHLGAFKRSQDILKQYKIHNGAEGYADYLVQLHNETINNSLNEIASYNVTSAQYAAQQSEIPEEE